jgi:Ser-tRNA(Ala) deacylase AlaX
LPIPALFDRSKMTSRTIPTYQRDGQLLTLETEITSSKPFSSYAESDRQLFKLKDNEESPENHIVVTSSTVFHPQGGGQPSDVGQIKSPGDAVMFDVSSVRQDTLPASETKVLHLGRYATVQHFHAGDPVTQTIDAEKRHLYSRLHTAGHVLGLAARHYLSEQGVTSITDGKASHFPSMANVEFVGLIDGKHKAGIQAKLDEYISKGMSVEIEELTQEQVDSRTKEGTLYMPENGMDLEATGGTLRVVNIVGAGAYPCGGTHVLNTKDCGKVSVYKISRQKGTSKVSYRLDD